MLKFFSKVLFVSILSGSLLLVDFSYKGLTLNTAIAESVKTEKISDKDLMGTLTMTAVGVLATRLYTYKMTTDMMLAAAGGAAFIGGEVLAFLKLKEVMKGMEVEITRDKKGNINQEQIAALERLKKSYEEAKETAETKKTLQMAAAAAFAAAGVAAFTMSGVEVAQLTACTSTIPTVISAASASAAACSVSGCSAPFLACVSAATALSGAITAYELKKQAMAPSGPALTAYTASNATLAAQVATVSGTCAASGGAAIAGACNVKLSTDILDASGGVGLMYAQTHPTIKKLLNDSDSKKVYANILKNSPIKQQGFVERALNYIIPQANAELFSAMGIASSAAVAFLLYTQKSLGPAIDLYMLIPRNRAIVWGVLAGLTFAATSATENVISQIESNIQKIDNILKSLNSLGKGVTTTQVATKTPNTNTVVKPGGAVILNGKKYEDVDLGGGSNGSLPCFTGNDEKKCTSFEDQAKDLPSYKGLNSESQAQLNDILKTANAFNGTSKISGASMSNAGKLAANALALRSAYDRAKGKYADSLTKSGSKFSLKDATDKLNKDIDKSVNDGLKRSKMSASAMMSSMYGGSGGGGAPGESSLAGADDKNAKSAAGSAGAGATVYDLSASGEVGSTNLDFGGAGIKGAEGTEGISAEDLAAANAANAQANPMDQYDIKNDINKDSTSSIFELISNRYQRSGYPRLFKVKEPQPPVKN